MRRRDIIKRSTLTAMVSTVVWASGCGDELLCLGPGEVGIQVEVRVAGTNRPAAWGAEGLAIDGDLVDTLRAFAEGGDTTQVTMLYATTNRPGTYEVRIHRVGFLEWVDRNVVVERRIPDCEGSVVPAMLSARLRRSPS